MSEDVLSHESQTKLLAHTFLRAAVTPAGSRGNIHVAAAEIAKPAGSRGNEHIAAAEIAKRRGQSRGNDHIAKESI